MSPSAAESRDNILIRSVLIKPVTLAAPDKDMLMFANATRGLTANAISLPLCGVPINMMARVVRSTSANWFSSCAIMRAYG